jgi:hypothetical protein
MKQEDSKVVHMWMRVPATLHDSNPCFYSLPQAQQFILKRGGYLLEVEIKAYELAQYKLMEDLEGYSYIQPDPKHIFIIDKRLRSARLLGGADGSVHPMKIATGWRQLRKEGMMHQHSGNLTLQDVQSFLTDIFKDRKIM